MRMGTVHSTLHSFEKSDYEIGYCTHCIGLKSQIMRMGTVHSTLYRFEKSDYENGYSTQYTV